MEGELEPFKVIKDIMATNIPGDPLEVYTNINNITELDIGQTVVFSFQDLEKYFSQAMYGEYVTK